MRFQRRQMLQTLSFAFGSSFILEREPTRLRCADSRTAEGLPPPAGAAVRDGIAARTEMEKVTGIGGFFFRAKDPKTLAVWYEQHLGICETMRVGARSGINRIHSFP